MPEPSPTPLAGVVVIDCSHMMQGPFAAQMLADLGADVVKVERPAVGERQRTTGATVGGESLGFMAMNTGKRSVAVDLKHPDGQEVVHRLASRADVLVENFRPGVMARLGLGPKEMMSRHPRLVYCSASGYGRHVDDPRRPGQDLLAQALTGVMWSTGSAGDPPTPAGLFVADAHAATLLALGAVAALFERERTGRGRLVEVDLIGAILHLQTQEVAAALHGLRRQRAPVAGHPDLPAPYGVYRAEDGYLALSLIDIGDLADVLGLPYLAGLDPSTDRDAVVAAVRDRVAQRPLAAWLDAMGRRGLWCAPVLDHRGMDGHPALGLDQRLARLSHPCAPDLRTVRNPVSFDTLALTPSRPSPRLAEHTVEVLAEFGYDRAEVDDLMAKGAVDGC